MNTCSRLNLADYKKEHADCKLEVEYQYGGHLFSKTGSNNISAMDWDISSKLVYEIDFDLVQRVSSPLKSGPEENLRRHGRRVETQYDVITPTGLV